MYRTDTPSKITISNSISIRAFWIVIEFQEGPTSITESLRARVKELIGGTFSSLVWQNFAGPFRLSPDYTRLISGTSQPTSKGRIEYSLFLGSSSHCGLGIGEDFVPLSEHFVFVRPSLMGVICYESPSSLTVAMGVVLCLGTLFSYVPQVIISKPLGWTYFLVGNHY